MNPELSRKGARIVHTDFCLSLSHEDRLNLIEEIEKATEFSDLSRENQKLWIRAEEEINESARKIKRKPTKANSKKAVV
jgi:hypothetical protein